MSLFIKAYIFLFSITALSEGLTIVDKVFMETLPKPNEVIAFGNNPLRGMGQESLPLSLAKETMMDFLAAGQPIPCPASDVAEKYGGLAPITLPGPGRRCGGWWSKMIENLIPGLKQNA